MSIEGTTHLVSPNRDATSPEMKILGAKFRRCVEDYLRYVNKFGQTFEDEDFISRIKRKYGRHGRETRSDFMYRLVLAGIEAHEFILSTSQDSCLDFEPICSLLNVDINKLRKKLKSLTQREAAQILKKFHKYYGH